jgi:hypothetical protein
MLFSSSSMAMLRSKKIANAPFEARRFGKRGALTGFATRALFTSPIGNLKTASTPPLDDDLTVPRAQFDLPNVSARAVNLLGYQGRALYAASRLALRNVAASVDANFCRLGIEVRLQHNSLAICESVASLRIAD